MTYKKTVPLRDGAELLLRNGVAGDGAAVLNLFNATHEETDYLLTYPDENTFTAETEAAFLQKKTDSDNEIEILAFVDGCLAGTAGIGAVGAKYKVKHRAEFGISVLQAYWGRGVGLALTRACIECAERAGYRQLELEVVADNAPAISLYQKCGFTAYGHNPKGFLMKSGAYQELVYMRLDLES